MLVVVIILLGVLGVMETVIGADVSRNMRLKAFDPHRSDFTCNKEADVVPLTDTQAEAWFQEGLRLSSPELWPEDRNYKEAVALWERATQRQHWKAMLYLADAYARGLGSQRDTERAVQIIEGAMRLGIPTAYDLMGTYYMNGVGVNHDVTRAYAFWQLAADMGSPSAMAYLGEKISGTYDDPPAFWGNRSISLAMLECALAQGNGKAAYELGMLLNGVVSRDYQRALKVLHEGVKFGSDECAGRLLVAFNDGDAMVGHHKDPARATRYRVFGNALRHNPQLRLPNLEKVLPLPPAALPPWDMSKPKTLIDTAASTAP
ncbi:tetratricopeptide repeat protein [Variovorax sp. OV329]|uniref:tetratricopeptide repeat protein n=1 Tax=Variovorax sp. OV329 TaxID=1882825 RepID=UPI0020C873CC|nr:tetratricopeptide repeat protein [Variovorax sp. OV329]